MFDICDDNSIDLGSRLRAAYYLALEGKKQRVQLITKNPVALSRLAGREKNYRTEEQLRFAVEHLSEVLGGDSIPVFFEIARNRTDPFVWQALAKNGAKTIPKLLVLLNDRADIGRRIFAADALGIISPSTNEVVEALRQILVSNQTDRPLVPLRRAIAVAFR